MNNKIHLNGADSASTSLDKLGACTACGGMSECKCDRCGDFYCSAECQLKDWPSHRFICFPMPKLVKVGKSPVNKDDVPTLAAKVDNSSKNTKSKEIKDLLPDGSCVFLTAFKNATRCFIRSTNPSSITDQQNILNKVDDFGKQAPQFSAKPNRISTALTLRDNKWCRVQILGYKDKVYNVSFTDFGEKGSRSLNELRKVSAEINNLPIHIHLVQLTGITNCSSSQQIMNTLAQFTNKEYKIKYSKPDKNGGNVELFMWGSSISLNSLIQELSSKNNDDADNKSAASSSSNIEGRNKVDKLPNAGSNGKVNQIKESPKESKTIQSMNGLEKNIDSSLEALKHQSKHVSSVPRQIQKQKPCLIPPFEIVSLNKNDGCSHILIMDNSFIDSGFVGCLLEKYCENLKAITEFLNQYHVGDEPYKPILNEYCLAQFDNMWYRAKVNEILSEDKFSVVYIDFTNEKELSSKFIRRYPVSLAYDCCTTLCRLDGLPDDLPTKLSEYLEETLKPFSILKIDSVRMEEAFCYIKSNELLQKLSDLKLI